VWVIAAGALVQLVENNVLAVDVRNQAQHKETDSVESEVDPVEDTLEEIDMDLDQVLSTAAGSDDDS